MTASTPRTDACSYPVGDCVLGDQLRHLGGTVEVLQRQLSAAQKALGGAHKDAFESGYIQGHEATVEGRYNLTGATMDYLAALEKGAGS